MEALMLDVRAIGGLTDDELFALCASNKMLRIERTKEGEIMLLHPTGGESGRHNTDIITDLNVWTRRTKLGIVFDSSTGFRLPNGAVRSPDAAFVRKERWEALSQEERRKFVPLCPDFVVELLSESDSLKATQEKMQEWMENGCRLAWLIDPQTETAYIYRADGSESTVQGFDNVLSGENVLPDFILELKELR
ncbi:MAG: Uma2 family endonuclease [Candidatus Kapabacteria bacterium]|jgi:Uma2 family endonuclease|nr:Uma2 family endonuclease [Candidatus Kapabacteria bacterium]